VVVTTAGGSATLTAGYTYVAAPTISAVSPASGPASGGTVVTISGLNFSSSTNSSLGVPGLDLSSLAGYYQFDDPTNLGKDSSGRNNDLQVFGTGVTHTAAGRTGGGLLLSAQGGLTTSDHTVPTGFPLGSSPYTI